jgi:two-component system cell cycle sensor histidine kinase/response regulator CckA
MNSMVGKSRDQASWPQPVPLTILLVEDESAVREATREVLEMAGYHVFEADGPEEAIRIVNERPAKIDLLLTDVVMPGMTGLELARRVCESRPGMVTVFMSGYAESEVLWSASRGILRSHIQKPFTVQGLLSHLAEALSKRRRGPSERQATQLPSP